MSPKAPAYSFNPQPFTLSIPQEQLDDLASRLDNARWPESDPVVDDATDEERRQFYGQGYGPTLPLMKEMVAEWKAFNFRNFEKELNCFNHYKVEIESLSIHFLHHTSESEDAIPLILCHGWPGSFHEFLDIIRLLTNPTNPEDQAFHCVIPSMPGYAFSSPPKTSHWKMSDTARVYDKLMTGLSYKKYAAQGGDWGSITARCLGALYPENCTAVHLNFCPAPSPSSLLSLIPSRTLLAYLPRWAMSDVQREKLSKALDYSEKGSAYYVMQRLTPRTPAYALNDSPIGLLAWIGEKMINSIDSTQGASPTLTRASLYQTLSLYWFSTHIPPSLFPNLKIIDRPPELTLLPLVASSIGTSFLPYALNPHFTDFLTSPTYRLPNFALSSFPREIAITPLEWVKKTGNLKWHKEADDGGHFAALEKPEVLAEHVREAIRVMWKQ